MDTERSADLKSEYYFRALRRTREQTAGDPKTEQKVQLLKNIIKEFHTQAARNLTRWESRTNPGISEIVTRISVLELIMQIQPGLQTDKQPAHISEQVLLSSMPNELPIFFKTDGGTHTALDIALDNAIRAIPKVVASLKDPNREIEDVVILATGNPCALGGTLTKEWAEKIATQGSYKIFAHLHAEQVQQELQDPRVSVTLIGHSYAGTGDLQTAIALEQSYPLLIQDEVSKQQRVRVLADSPVLGQEVQPTATEKQKNDKGKTVVVGAVKAALKAVWDRREDFAAKLWIGKAYKRQLKTNGITVESNKEQKQLRHQILTRVKSDLSVILPKLYPLQIPTYIRMGAYDETLPDLNREAKFESWVKHPVPSANSQNPDDTRTSHGVAILEHPQPNVRIFGLDTAHAIERIRDKHWLRAVNALA